MTSLKFLFNDYVEKDGPIVTFGYNSEGTIKGIDTIKCIKIKLKNVYYVKDLQNNLTSIIQLCDDGYKVLFNDNEGKVIDSKESIMLIAFRKNDIYMF